MYLAQSLIHRKRADPLQPFIKPFLKFQGQINNDQDPFQKLMSLTVIFQCALGKMRASVRQLVLTESKAQSLT